MVGEGETGPFRAAAEHKRRFWLACCFLALTAIAVIGLRVDAAATMGSLLGVLGVLATTAVRRRSLRPRLPGGLLAEVYAPPWATWVPFAMPWNDSTLAFREDRLVLQPHDGGFRLDVPKEMLERVVVDVVGGWTHIVLEGFPASANRPANPRTSGWLPIYLRINGDVAAGVMRQMRACA